MNVGSEGWYVADAEGNARGPFTQAQLQTERDAGRVRDEHLVWTLRLSEWVPLKRAFGGQTAAEKAATPAQPQPAAAPKPVKSAAKPARPQAKSPPSRAPLPGTSPARMSDDWRESAGKPAPARLAEALLAAGKDKEQARNRERVGESVRRWLARQIDTVLLGGIGWALLALLGHRFGFWSLGYPSLELAQMPVIAVIVLVLAALPLEAVLVGLLGRTPGRALLGLRVTDVHGAAPGLRAGAERAARVALYGQAMLVFPFFIFAYAVAGGSLVKNGRTHWDQALGLLVRSEPINANRWWTALVVLAVGWAMFLGDGWMKLAAQIQG